MMNILEANRKYSATHICSDCHTSFTPTHRNWVGSDKDLPLCNRCLDAEEYDLKGFHQTRMPRGNK